MIKSEIKLNKENIPIATQRIIVICEKCGKETEHYLYNQIKGLKKYNMDLCRGCKQKEQIISGKRGKQYINAGLSAINNMKGKTHIEMYGEEKAAEMSRKNSFANSGKNNANYGGIWHSTPPATLYKGKTYDEIYGKEKSDLIKGKLSIAFSGKNNPMYGKPSPKGSGNGWCGWYKQWFFRSLLELSFLIFYVERFSIKCETAERKKYKIKYIDYDSNERSYFPDFILNDKYLIEIKPKNLKNSFTNIRKMESAIPFCKKNNLIYKIITPIKKLKFKEINQLFNNKQLKFIDKYEKKFIEWKNNQRTG